jgi:hypothetical protein
VVTYIANKFLKKTDGGAPVGDFDMDKSAEEEAMQKMKEQRRKQQQLEMREMLDMQIQLQKQEKEIQLEERRAIGQKINLEANQYEAEQQRKKTDHILKQKAHQREVTKQIEQRSNALRSAGSQVLAKN